MEYTQYSIEDFVADEYFIRWVKRPTEESNAFWNSWLSLHPDKEGIIKEARQIIQMLQFEEVKVPEGKVVEVWGNILAAEERTVELTGSSPGRSQPSRSLSIWYKVAAVGLLLVIAFAYVLLNKKEMVTIQTAFGESRTLFLPDSSKVTLNANSTLRYATDFDHTNREVWLDGEAFFAVARKINNQNFLVYTQELQVEVLGTRFNVNTRRGKSRVVLEEGRVRLNVQAKDQPAMVMEPGDMVQVDSQTKQIERKQVEVSNYSEWRNNRLVFVSMPLEEIAELLEDNYGYEVVFGNEALTSMEFTGSASVDNLQELLEKLERVFNLDIEQEGKKMFIKKG